MGDIGLAEKMISSAVTSGANIVKFQYWDPKLLKDGPWDNDGRREIYNKAYLDQNKVSQLIKLSDEYGCEFLISVFGTTGAKAIKDIGQSKIKIPSHETTNYRLIDYCINNFEFVYFSAGASSEDEVKKAVKLLDAGSGDYNLMHCVSAYPCEDDRINLRRINWLKSFTENIGLSDHTMSTLVPSLAVTYGVKVIEKHFTTDNTLPGRDNQFALEPSKFSKMVDNIYSAERAIIDHGIGHQDIEKDTMENYRGRWESSDYE